VQPRGEGEGRSVCRAVEQHPGLLLRLPGERGSRWFGSRPAHEPRVRRFMLPRHPPVRCLPCPAFAEETGRAAPDDVQHGSLTGSTARRHRATRQLVHQRSEATRVVTRQDRLRGLG
jgi:hypothetical protein